MWWKQANGLRRCFKRILHTFLCQSQNSVICEEKQRKKLRSPIRSFGARLSINAISFVYENREYVLHTLSSAQWPFNIQIWMNRIHEIIRVQKDETNDKEWNLNVSFRDTKNTTVQALTVEYDDACVYCGKWNIIVLNRKRETTNNLGWIKSFDGKCF